MVSACCSSRMCWLYVCIVVLGAHLVVSTCCTSRMCWLYVCIVVLGAHLVVSTCCTSRMCWLYVCIVVLGAHLVLLVLSYVLAKCEVGCLTCTWCKRGVALVKFQTIPISYGVTGHIYILWCTH